MTDDAWLALVKLGALVAVCAVIVLVVLILRGHRPGGLAVVLTAVVAVLAAVPPVIAAL